MLSYYNQTVNSIFCNGNITILWLRTVFHCTKPKKISLFLKDGFGGHAPKKKRSLWLWSSKRWPALLNFDRRISFCSIEKVNSFMSSTRLRASVVDLMVEAGGSKSTSWPCMSLSATTTNLLAGSSDSFWQRLRAFSFSRFSSWGGWN